MIKESDLKLQDLKIIETENLGKNLPHGIFYDGNFYRDDNGKILQGHPSFKFPNKDLANLKKEYVERINSQSSEVNKELDLINQKIMNLYN